MGNRLENRARRRPRRDLKVAVTTALALLALGCDPFGTEHRFKNQGRVCLFPGGNADGNPFLVPRDPQTYQADQALDLVITMPDCLSSSCSHDPKASCTATREGGVIQIESTASYVEKGTTCTTDCGALSARCSTPPLPAGRYELRHGNTTVAITVPSTVVPPCAGSGLGGS